MSLVEFTPIGCVKEQTVGAPPPCEEGEPEGTLKPAFHTIGCEGVFFTSQAEVREVVSRALSRDPQIALYAVARSGESYMVATNYGQQASPTQLGLIWTVNQAGSIIDLGFGCWNYIASALEDAAPSGTLILGPFGSCFPPPGAEVELVVLFTDVAGQLAGVAGPASPIGTNVVTERAVVEVTPGTQWSGPVSRFGDLRPGMRLQVKGHRLQDCAIRADRIEVLK